MKFDIKDYPGKYVMHCKTQKEASDFCNYLHNIGRTWSGGDSYKDINNYKHYETNTAYNFNQGSFCNVNYYKREGYTILEWEDFMKRTFTKADLRGGDMVKRRDGQVCVVFAEVGAIAYQDGYDILEAYRDDLTNKHGYKDLDIIAVHRPTKGVECRFDCFERNYVNLVYEREEVEEMTLAEVCKLLGKNIKIVK